jgi:hypothetical protein
LLSSSDLDFILFYTLTTDERFRIPFRSVNHQLRSRDRYGFLILVPLASAYTVELKI